MVTLRFCTPLPGANAAAIILSAMKIKNWKLCLVADANFTAGKDLPSLTLKAIKAGASIVQLRAKNLDAGEFLDLAFRIAKRIDPYNIPFIINDKVDIAQACKADGVHLGQKDMPLSQAREILGNDKIIGISVNTVKQALKAEKGGADYLGASPLFYTDSKKDLDLELGLKGLQEMRKQVKIPILAIGGINSANASEVMAAGADGIAVISAILGADDISRATQKLLKAVNKIS